MSIDNANHRESRLKVPTIVQPMSEVTAHPRLSLRLSHFRLPIFLSVLLMLFCQLLPAGVYAQAFQAFYYDAQGVLLQVESVPNREMANRKLVDPDEAMMLIPMLNKKIFPLVSGNNLNMSKLAAIAVYYTYEGDPQDGDVDVPARPVKVEYLQFVGKRTLAKCLPRDSNDACLFPKRCHCTFGSCCCY